MKNLRNNAELGQQAEYPSSKDSSAFLFETEALKEMFRQHLQKNIIHMSQVHL